MASGIRIELDHSALERIEDSYAETALELAEGIKKRADKMRSKGVDEYEAGLRDTKTDGGMRRYAVVAANEASTRAEEHRRNILAKAMK